jgi:hypothetical protein
MSEATYTLSLVLAIQLDAVLLGCYQRGALFLWEGCLHHPDATLLWCISLLVNTQYIEYLHKKTQLKL